MDRNHPCAVSARGAGSCKRPASGLARDRAAIAAVPVGAAGRMELAGDCRGDFLAVVDPAGLGTGPAAVMFR